MDSLKAKIINVDLLLNRQMEMKKDQGKCNRWCRDTFLAFLSGQNSHIDNHWIKHISLKQMVNTFEPICLSKSGTNGTISKFNLTFL